MRTLFSILLILVAPALPALETDQFMVWEVPLEDSRPAINAFVAGRMAAALAQLRAAGRTDLECAEVPPILFRDLHFNLLSSRIRRFLATSPAIDRYPSLDEGYRDYLLASIFRRPAFPYLLPMARTVRFGDVTLGIDKFGHLFAFGRRYYVRVRRRVEEGMDPQAALSKVIRWGIRLEDSLVGRMTDGVFSHADLEANYQGYRLAVDLCAAQPPHLELRPDGWDLARPVDLAGYVNPNLDEAFNNSHYARYRWKRVEPVLRREICPEWYHPEVQARMRRYARRARRSFSMEVVDAYFAQRGGNPQSRYALDRVCARAPQVAVAGRPATRTGVHETGRARTGPPQ